LCEKQPDSSDEGLFFTPTAKRAAENQTKRPAYSLLPCLVGLVPLVQHVRDSLARLPHFFGENERFHLPGG
jgi:hypothetical protein